MDINVNSNKDLIELNNRYKCIEEKTTIIDKISLEVERRKKVIFEKIVDFENRRIKIPTDIEQFIVILIETVEARKKLRDEWASLCNLRERMDEYTNGSEKIITERGDYKPKPDEIKEIEILIKQYEDISIKQENLLNERIQIQEEENTALDEIEKIITRIKE